MFSEAEILYLEEVLGISPKWYRVPGSFPTDSARDPGTADGMGALAPARNSADKINFIEADRRVWVLTGPLRQEEKVLLAKILSSIHLKTYRHCELPDSFNLDKENFNVDSLLEIAASAGLTAPRTQSRDEGQVHAMVFAPVPFGRQQAADGRVVWWAMPELARMMNGEPAQIAAFKRQAWASLQQLKREIGTASSG